jgi:hypothetical protein
MYETTTYLAVSYGCETWSLNPRERYRTRMFENRGLRKIFGSKMEDAVGS